MNWLKAKSRSGGDCRFGTWAKIPALETVEMLGHAGFDFLVNTITGVIIHKKIFKDFFTFRPRAKSRQRSWLDAHNVLGVLPWLFHLMIIVTGLTYPSFDYLPSASTTLNGDPAKGINYLAPPRAPTPAARPTPLQGAAYPIVEIVRRAEAEFGPGAASVSIRNPGGGGPVTVDVSSSREGQITGSKRVRMTLDGRVVPAPTPPSGPMRTTWDTLTSLHFVFFGGTPMRLLYFLCGAAGTAMMAGGLLLFSIKRREKAHGPGAALFYRIVDRLNLAVIGGPMLACAGYLWGVRLLPHTFPESKFFYRFSTFRFLPLDQASRLEWEIYVFWLVWGAAAVHAALRSPAKAWTEQLAALAVLCLGLPVLGYLTPNSGLLAMMAAGDWKTAGVDLAALALGLAFAWGAWKVGGKGFVRFTSPAPAPSAAE